MKLPDMTLPSDSRIKWFVLIVVSIVQLAALGGGGNFPEGSLGVGTRYQKEHNINTTVDQVLTAALQYHHYRADPHVLRVLNEESGKTID